MNIVTYCHKVSLSQPQFIEYILFKNLTLYSKMAAYNFQTLKQMNLGVTVTELALLLQAYETLQCMSNRICPCISNKQMCNSHTHLDFVFDDKTFREHLKKY